MAVQKNTHQSTNDFGSLGELIKSQQAGATTHQKEGTMPNSKKTAAAAASDETMLTPEAILEKARPMVSTSLNPILPSASSSRL